MKRWSFLFLVAFLLAGCGGAGTPVEPLSEEEISQNITSAKSFLESGDISSAYESYAEIVAGGGGSNSEARFGKALTEALLVMESDEAAALLGVFGQNPITTDVFFTDSGYFYNKLRSTLPFYSLRECSRQYFMKKLKLRCLIGSMNDTETFTGFMKRVQTLDPYLAEIQEDLESAKVDGFSFVIPKAMFNAKKDVTIDRSDVGMMIASVRAARAAIDLALSWNFDINPGAMFNEMAKYVSTKQEFVDILNKSFFLLPTNRLSSARGHVDVAVLETIDALEEKVDGLSSGAAWELYHLAVAGREMLKGSYEAPFTTPAVNLDLSRFFIDPPDAADIPYDPFVLEGTKIRAVEAFWSQMLQKGAGVDVDYLRGVKFRLAKLKMIRNLLRDLNN